MTRGLLNLLTTLSLLLCVAAAVLWVATIRRAYAVEFDGVVGRSDIVAYRGWFVQSNDPQRQAEASAWDMTFAQLSAAQEQAAAQQADAVTT